MSPGGSKSVKHLYFRKYASLMSKNCLMLSTSQYNYFRNTFMGYGICKKLAIERQRGKNSSRVAKRALRVQATKFHFQVAPDFFRKIGSHGKKQELEPGSGAINRESPVFFSFFSIFFYFKVLQSTSKYFKSTLITKIYAKSK